MADAATVEALRAQGAKEKATSEVETKDTELQRRASLLSEQGAELEQLNAELARLDAGAVVARLGPTLLRLSLPPLTHLEIYEPEAVTVTLPGTALLAQQPVLAGAFPICADPGLATLGDVWHWARTGGAGLWARPRGGRLRGIGRHGPGVGRGDLCHDRCRHGEGLTAGFARAAAQREAYGHAARLGGPGARRNTGPAARRNMTPTNSSSISSSNIYEKSIKKIPR